MSLQKLPKLASLLFALAAAASPALATTVSFTDSTRHWAGWGNGTGDDARDTIGSPDLSAGAAIFDDTTGRLTGVRIDWTGRFSPVASGNGRVLPGDLFIDLGSDGHWDFVVETIAGPQTPVASYDTLSVLDVHDILTPSYLLSGSDNTGYWRGYLIRDGHPYAWDGGGTVVGGASLAPFDALATSGSLLFDLGGGLPTTGSISIGFAVSCANDVLLAQVSAPTPEPAAALTFAVGLAVVARAGRRPRRSTGR